MPNESTIIVPVPEAEPLFGTLRGNHDRVAAAGIPAHITLLYPFLPPAFALEQVTELERLFGSMHAFEFSLVDVRRFSATLYLHPNEAGRFRAMTDMLSAKWPGCKPYNGAFADVIPHLTVADKVDAATMDTVEPSIRPHLPIRCTANEVWLMCSDNQDRWSRKACYRFANGHF
ncbi:MAG TPA: 2'-5' RNA ligase family protein [Terriglobales bacterium]